MRHVAVISLGLLFACGSSPGAGGTGPANPGPSTGRAIGPGAGSATVATPPAVARDVGCPSPTCAFHAGAGAYFTCTSSGSGACVHFGPACTPPDACMYDPAARAYKLCTRPSEGTCLAWGGACAPASRCMFDPKDGYHRTCDEVSGGTCKRPGALCTP